jgi:hypothetical protein
MFYNNFYFYLLNAKCKVKVLLHMIYKFNLLKKMKHLLLLMVGVLFLVSCGKNGEGLEIEEYVGAFVSENDSVLAFGKADIQTILEKADYKNIPKVGKLVETWIGDMEQGVDVSSSIFYAVQPTFFKNVSKATIYAFYKVENSDSLRGKLTRDGYDIEQDGEFNFYQSDDVSFGFDKDLGVLIVQGDDYDGKKLLEETISRCKDGERNDKVMQILESKEEIVLGMNMGAMANFMMPSTGQKISAEQQKKLKELTKGSYSKSTIRFEKGEVVIDIKNLYTDAYKEHMFFKSNNSKNVKTYLGSGNPRIAMALNMDMDKCQNYLDEYFPGMLDEMTKNADGRIKMAMMAGGDKALPGLFGGQIGFSLSGDMNDMEGMIPQVVAFMTLGDKGGPIAEIVKETYSSEMMQIESDNNGIKGYSGAAKSVAHGSFKAPSWFSSFGEKGFSFFVNFEGLDLESIGLQGNLHALTMIQYIKIEMDNDGGQIVIKSKNNSQNILKETTDFAVQALESQIDAMNF